MWGTLADRNCTKCYVLFEPIEFHSLPIGALSLETSATAPCGRYVIQQFNIIQIYMALFTVQYILPDCPVPVLVVDHSKSLVCIQVSVPALVPWIHFASFESARLTWRRGHFHWLGVQTVICKEVLVKSFVVVIRIQIFHRCGPWIHNLVAKLHDLFCFVHLTASMLKVLAN